MSISRANTWAALEVLTADELNAEFDNIINNGEDLAWPATQAKDLNGQELILDADGDTSITSDTDDRIDFKIGGSDIFRMDKNGLRFRNSYLATTMPLQGPGDGMALFRGEQMRSNAALYAASFS